MITKEKLDELYKKRNISSELCIEKPDPLLIAKDYRNDHRAILLCALYGYGNAKLIIKFLTSLDFSLLNMDEQTIRNELDNKYYRFQNNQDVIESFITLYRIQQENSLYDIFYSEYRKENSILDAINKIIEELYHINNYRSKGYSFLFGSPLKKDSNNTILYKKNGPYKRWNMFLRWMVRNDNLDLGLWEKVHTKDLIIPLDTHTFNVSLKNGLLNRKIYDLQAALDLTNKLKQFDSLDPVKYDFALYRIGQEKLL